MSTQPEAHARTLHDRLFKGFLHRFLPDFLTIFFSAEAARLGFSTLTFPRQELIVNLPGQVLRITDVVAKVNTVSGEPETIIVHVKVGANEPKPLPQRMFDYYACCVSCGANPCYRSRCS
jgi:hypothetical protein